MNEEQLIEFLKKHLRIKADKQYKGGDEVVLTIGLSLNDDKNDPFDVSDCFQTTTIWLTEGKGK